MEQLPILPLGQLVVYPHVVLPLALTDPNAVQLIDEVVRGNKRLLLGVVKPIGGTEPAEGAVMQARPDRSEEHTSELQSRLHLVCRLLLEKKKKKKARTLSYSHVMIV